MRFLSVLFLVATATTAFASPDAEDGIAAAEQICAKQFLPSDVRACLAIVKEAKFFDEAAVNVCGAQFLPTDVRKCLTGIRDKEFRPAILDACGKLFLPSEIVACLVENGKPWTGGTTVDLDKVREGVKRALRHLRNFEVRKAEAVLEEVLKLLDC